MIKILILAISLAYADGNTEDNKCEAQIVTKIIYKDRVVDRPVEKEVTRKNRLFLLLGNGPSDSLTLGGTTAISGDENFVGLGYMRDIGRLNLGVQVDSSESVSGTIGINW